jgi:hypothetical protein
MHLDWCLSPGTVWPFIAQLTKEKEKEQLLTPILSVYSQLKPIKSRMHTSRDMNIYIHVTSEPIIEDCTDMRLAPYGQILPAEELDRLFEVNEGLY